MTAFQRVYQEHSGNRLFKMILMYPRKKHQISADFNWILSNLRCQRSNQEKKNETSINLKNFQKTLKVNGKKASKQLNRKVHTTVLPFKIKATTTMKQPKYSSIRFKWTLFYSIYYNRQCCRSFSVTHTLFFRPSEHIKIVIAGLFYYVQRFI